MNSGIGYVRFHSLSVSSPNGYQDNRQTCYEYSHESAKLECQRER